MSEVIPDKKKVMGWLAQLSLGFAAILVLLFIAIVVFSIAYNLAFSKQNAFDENVFTFISQYRSPGFTQFMLGVTFLGKHTFLIPANLLLLVSCFILKNKWFAIKVATLSLSSLGLLLLLKNIFQRARPTGPLVPGITNYSFPSGHSLMSVTFYGLLIYIAWHEIENRWLRITAIVLLCFLILMIAFSRIYLRVHYASDVMAGLALGFIWIILSLYILDNIQARYFSKKTAVNSK
ncbi:MAG: phosphatase PAP2 family protein [Bacteroidota bacterium]